MCEKIRVAFAGLRHAHIVTLYKRLKADERFEITAVCEENSDAAEFAAKNWQISATHRDFEQMLESAEFDVLAVGDYYGIRGKRAIAALRRGKHILSDKPLCTALEELEEIKMLAAEKNLKIGLMLDLRSNPALQATRELISSGSMGKIHAVNFGGQHPLNYGVRPGWYFEAGKHGGTINDIAIHGIDAVEYLTGRATSGLIAARSWNAFAVQEPDFRDSAQMLYTLEDGCGVTADVSYAAPDKFGFSTPLYWRFTVWGSNGVAEFCAKSDTVRFYDNVSGGIREVAPQQERSDYLEIFLNELKGNDEKYGTGHIIRVTAGCLELQRKAMA